MKTLTTIKSIAAVALLACSTATLSHTDKPHSSKPAVVKKEQQAWGIAGDAKDAKRTIAISMSDNMRFSPDKIDVKQGETVKIVLTNTGKVLHELVIGTKKVLDDHAAQMVKFPNMEHDEPHMAHVSPGKKGEIVWTFNRPGEFDFACLIAGHYQAGMVGKISVVAAPGKAAALDNVVPQNLVTSISTTTATVSTPEMAEAEVRKVDKEAKKVTLKHGPIKSLDMPSMTMVFQVKDPALLDKLVAGDKVKISAEQQQGAYVLTGIEKLVAP